MKTLDAYLSGLHDWRTKHISSRHYVYILSVLVGLMSGLAAVVLKNTVYYTHYFLTKGFEVGSWNLLYLLYPLFGIILTVYAVSFLARENITHGISRVLHAISKKNGHLKKHDSYSSLIGSTLTVGFGGSVGLEAPIVMTGAAMASNLARVLKLDYRTTVLLIACGAAGAVSGIFRAPIAGVVFALEVLMLDLTMASLIPLLLASITGTSISALLMGQSVLFLFTPENQFLYRNLPFYIGLGVFAGLVSVYFTRMNHFIEDSFKKITSIWTRMVLGGLGVSVLIFLFPPLFGEGYVSLKQLLTGTGDSLASGSIFYGIQDNAWLFTGFIFLILLLKVIAMSLTTGAGGVGGVFAPSLFVGGLSGFFFARAINVSGFFQVPETNFALAGMAGVMAGVMHAPLTAIFLIAEITGGYDFFIPLMVTATIGYMTNSRFEPHGVYSKRLAEKGDLTTHNKDKAILSRMKIDELIEKNFNTVEPNDYLGSLVKEISKSERNVFPVVDRQGRFFGVVFLNDIRHIIFKHELYGKVLVKELMYMPDPLVELGESMESVAQKFHDSNHYNLPVLDKGNYIGFVSRANVFSAYREMLKETSED
jgi:CIC family chloride channel protein